MSSLAGIGGLLDQAWRSHTRPARDGRRRPAFVVVRTSRRRFHGPCSARPAGQTRPEGRVMLSGASRAPAPRRPGGGSALLAALSRALLPPAEMLVIERKRALPALLDPAGWSSPIARRK